ncbi:MAG TPA: DUF192 domain-containing protein [Acetobacteraceae bacterium]|jgi:uncharacterized protein|nr:DUF192 domain-containing protein [Acetobacteraceae bacterium]
MNRRHLLLLLAALPAIARAQEDKITAPQPKLPTEKLTIVTKDGKRHDFTVELATTPREQEVGEMFRKVVPPDQGMLFVFDFPRESPFWMKNTLVPLDMVFINPDGTIRAIADNTVPESLAPVSSHGPVLAVLELAGGITAKLNIVVGDKVVAKQFNDVG